MSADPNNNPEELPPKLLTLSSGEKIPYHSTNPPLLTHGTANKSNQKEAPGVLFCNGFRSSSMTGTKALALGQYCQQRRLCYTRFDYRGHGEDNDDNNTYFETLGLTDWIADARAMLCHCYEEQQGRPQIVIGSSMGVWIAIHLALLEPNKVAGVLGIAAAPDFTLGIWEGLTSDQRQELEETGRVLLPSQYSSNNAPYPISRYLLQDGLQWLLFKDNNDDKASEQMPNNINVTCPIRLIHGQQDVDIPWKKSLQLANAVSSEDVHVTLIKNGDHRLSTVKDLEVICRVLDDLLDTIRGEQRKKVPPA